MTAPTPVYFTVTADYTGFDGGPVNGRGTIAPVFGQGQIAVLSGTPNVGIVPSSVDFRIVNGVMWAANVYGVSSAATAPTQVQLVANSGLNITGDFYYQVTFYELTVDDAPTGMAPFAFTAPTGATTLDLLSVTPVPSPSHPGGQAKGDQGFSFAGLQPVSGGTAVQGLVQSASGPVAVGSAVTLPVGPTGPANSLSIGSVSSVGPNAGSATVGGTAPNQSLSLALPRGYSFAGLTASGDGTHVQGLVETATGTAPIGDAIGISLSYNSTVTHGSNAATARPPVSVSVIWIGSVQPSNAISGDVWLDTSGVAPSISTTSLNPLNAGVPFMQQLNVSAGTQPIVWAVSSGSLPAGLALSSAGVLSGAPSTSGTYTFAVSATNGYGAATQTFSSVSVGAAVAPTITTSTLGTLTVGTPVSVQLTYTGSTPTWSSGTLPDGLSLNYLTGYISGTPTTAARGGHFTVTATNPGGATSQDIPSDVRWILPTYSAMLDVRKILTGKKIL